MPTQKQKDLAKPSVSNGKILPVDFRQERSGECALAVAFFGQELHLLPERAVWWGGGRTLFVADAHFGKSALYRKSVPALPKGTTTSDLERLSALVTRWNAERLVFLGDTLHSSSVEKEPTLGQVAQWRRRCDLAEVLSVPGNHDPSSRDAFEKAGIRELPVGSKLGPFFLSHHPVYHSDDPALCGHLHPGYRVQDAGGSLKLPCYWMARGTLHLPAFGSFTGLQEIRPEPQDLVAVIAGTKVLRMR